MKTYYVYIMASPSRTLYTGVTNNLERRVLEHRRKLVPGFTARYNITRLVHYEVFGDIRRAIHREKQIKGWLRSKKIALIESANRDWKDLSKDRHGEERAGRHPVRPGDKQSQAALPDQETASLRSRDCDDQTQHGSSQPAVNERLTAGLSLLILAESPHDRKLHLSPQRAFSIIL